MQTFLITVLLFVTADALGLFFTNKTGVFFNDTGTVETVIPYGDGGATHVDFNGNKEVYAILYSDNPQSHRIVRVKFPGSSNNPKNCVRNLPDWCTNDEGCSSFCSASRYHSTDEGFKPEDCFRASNLAVDWVYNTVYWTCGPKDKTNVINMASLNGSNPKVVKKLDNAQVVDLKIDPYQRKLFWLQKRNEVITLQSSNLDGKEENEIYKPKTTNTHSLKFLFLDINNKMIHVTSNKTDHGVFMDYNGDNVEEIESKLLKQFKIMQVGTHSRLYSYYPNIQEPNIKCSEYNCNGGCRFLTLKGVQCWTNTAKEGTKQTTPTVITGTGDKKSDPQESGSSLNTPASRTEETKKDESRTTVVDKKIQAPAGFLTTDIPRDTGVVTVFTNETTGTNVDRASNVTENFAEPSTTAEAGLPRGVATFFLVAMTIGVAIYFVVVIINRKVKQGNYRPASPEESLTALNH